ncbi:hypothetical protein [Streptomyces sp. NPDC054854]
MPALGAFGVGLRDVIREGGGPARTRRPKPRNNSIGFCVEESANAILETRVMGGSAWTTVDVKHRD